MEDSGGNCHPAATDKKVSHGFAFVTGSNS